MHLHIHCWKSVGRKLHFTEKPVKVDSLPSFKVYWTAAAKKCPFLPILCHVMPSLSQQETLTLWKMPVVSAHVTIPLHEWNLLWRKYLENPTIDKTTWNEKFRRKIAPENRQIDGDDQLTLWQLDARGLIFSTEGGAKAPPLTLAVIACMWLSFSSSADDIFLIFYYRHCS